jgi:hypothetical protein
MKGASEPRSAKKRLMTPKRDMPGLGTSLVAEVVRFRLQNQQLLENT